MRRQLKPFVTEYRASNRRGKDASRGEHEVSRPNDAGHDLFRPAAGRSNPGRGDRAEGMDGYGAALKAADALFAVREPAPAVAEPGSQQTGTSPARGRILRAIEQPQPTRPEAADASGGAAIDLGPPQPEAALGDTAAASSEAIVEAPSPMRRGRKPGMKDRKRVVIDEPEDAIDGDDAPRIALAPASVISPAEAAPAHRRARRDPFPWVRTQLRPGEKWKRRLPKVAW